jgi:hypothetical protein
MLLRFGSYSLEQGTTRAKDKSEAHVAIAYPAAEIQKFLSRIFQRTSV